MVDKLKAIELRKEGKSYKEISDLLDCSEAWCKLNLKDVSKDEETSKQIQQCVDISRGRNGITNMEILKIMENSKDFWSNSEKSKENRKKILKKIRQKVRNSGGILRPFWMIPEESQESFSSILEKVNELDTRIYEIILEFRKEFDLDSSYDMSILVGLSQLSQIGTLTYGSSGVIAMCESYSEAAQALAKKRDKTVQKYINRPTLVSSVNTENTSEINDLDDFAY